MTLIEPPTSGLSLIAPEMEAGSIGPSKKTAMGVRTLTPTVLGAGTSVVALRPMSTVLKVEMKAGRRVPSVSTAGSPILT